jgi:hypothetical protein
MPRSLLAPACTLFVLMASAALAFEVTATINSVDADGRRLQFTAKGQDRSAHVDADARILDDAGQPLAAGLKADALKPGAVVVLTIEPVNNQPHIRGIRLGGTLGQAGQAQPKANAKAKAAQPAVDFKFPDTSGLVPLTDLGTGRYQGFEGGLYPGGSNVRPASHEAAGLALAKQIQPLDAEGKPAADGKIVLLGIGFSNTVQAFNGFMKVAEREESTLNPHLVLVNGAVGGMAAQMVQQADTDRGKQYWIAVDQKLEDAGVTRAQVQAVWIKETNPQQLNVGGFPKEVQDFQAQLANIVRLVHDRFPNVKLAYFTSRTYGGWARPVNGRGPGNSEPWSYSSAFGYKWLIEQQLGGDPTVNYDPARGPVKAPWMSWGPYIWANGEKPRSDGFRFALEDFMATDQMHESPQGQIKVGMEILKFFKTDTTTRTWFLR